MKRLLLALLAGTLGGAALGQDPTGHQCTFGDLSRRIEIIYETGVTVPCEVHYYKDTEAPGDMQVLWRALSEEGYCEARASEFVAKLEAMGWDCAAGADAEPPAEPAVEPAVEDDTDALAPAEDIAPTESELRD